MFFGLFTCNALAETITVPIWRDIDGRARVDVTFDNGETYNFIIDTGMMKTMILPSLVDALGLVETTPEQAGAGSHGQVMPGAVYLSQKVIIGGQVEFRIGTPQVISNLKISEETVYGVLGSEFLQQYTVMFDPEAGRMILSTDGAEDLIAGGDFVSRSMYSPFANLWMMEAEVGPVPVTVFLDTGANRTLINPKTFEAQTPDDFIGETREDRQVMGVSGGAESFSVVVRRVLAGEKQWQDRQLTVTSGIFSQLRLLDKPAMIMGSDLLLSGKLIMDYPNRQVFFEVGE